MSAHRSFNSTADITGRSGPRQTCWLSTTSASPLVPTGSLCLPSPGLCFPVSPALRCDLWWVCPCDENRMVHSEGMVPPLRLRAQGEHGAEVKRKETERLSNLRYADARPLVMSCTVSYRDRSFDCLAFLQGSVGLLRSSQRNCRDLAEHKSCNNLIAIF